MRRWRDLIRSRRGASALEFGIVAPVVLLLLFGIVGAGMLLWGIGTLYSVAALSARCGAVGTAGTPPCTTTTATSDYAVSLVDTWLFTGAIAVGDVTSTASVATCKGVTGTFYQVAITSNRFANLPGPLNGITISVSSCYPRL